MFETLKLEREGAIAWLTLNRPERLNAMSRQLVADLRELFSSLPEDRQTRVVVLRGAGRAFCAGLALKERGSGEEVESGVPAGLRAPPRAAASRSRSARRTHRRRIGSHECGLPPNWALRLRRRRHLFLAPHGPG